MALKSKITKAEFEKLDKLLQAEYEADGEGYKLDTDADDPEELRRARDREKQTSKDLKKQLKEATDKLAELDGDDARKSGDIAKLEKSWQDKLTKETGDRDAKLSKKDEFIKKSLINGTALEMATRISNAPKLLAKAIAERLTVNFDGDEPKLEILGDDGKVIPKDLAFLEKEFVTNKEFASIIIGSKATGGSAPRRTQTERPPGSAEGSGNQPLDLSKLGGKDLAAELKARKEANAQ
jgi:hypothetical protein